VRLRHPDGALVVVSASPRASSIAEVRADLARAERATLVARAVSGAASNNATQSMLWVCQRLSIRCVNPLIAFRELGLGGGGTGRA